MRVLLVEDDIVATKFLSLALRSSGLVLDHAGTGAEALGLVGRYDYDAIILDLLLPDMDGYDVVRRMRGRRIETPVLIVSGLSRLDAKITGLGVGADDFITKPFEKAELLARLGAVVRRTRGLSQSVLSLGDLEINLDNKEVTVARKRVHLTVKEYSIMELLALRRGHVLSKETFLNHLYGGVDEPDAKIIDVFICKLRRKLALAGLTDLVLTMRGRGYVVRGAASAAVAEPEGRAPAADEC